MADRRDEREVCALEAEESRQPGDEAASPAKFLEVLFARRQTGCLAGRCADICPIKIFNQLHHAHDFVWMKSSI